MERRIREWVIGRDDVGRAVLEWKEASLHPEQVDDAAITWADLDVSSLTLEDEPKHGGARGFDPYDRRPACAPERKRTY